MGSSDLGVAKRVKEYQRALVELGHPEFEVCHGSIFGKFWAELEEQDYMPSESPWT